MNTSDTSPTEPFFSYRTKRTLAIIGVIGAAIMTVVFVYAALVAPAKQPYRAALAQYENVGKANALLTTTGSSLNPVNASDEAFEKNIKTAQEALTMLRQEQKLLGHQEVLKLGEGKALYDAFDAKMQPYMDYNEDVLASMLKVRPALRTCNEDMGSLSGDEQSIAVVNTCIEALAKVGTVPDVYYNTMITSFIADYTRLVKNLESTAVLVDPEGADGARATELEEERSDIVTSLKQAGTAFTTDTQNHRRELLTTDTSQKLKEYLRKASALF